MKHKTCKKIKRYGEGCPLNNSCKYPNCLEVGIEEHFELLKEWTNLLHGSETELNFVEWLEIKKEIITSN